MDYSFGIMATLDKIFGGVLVGGLRVDNPMKEDIKKSYNINMARFIGNFPSNIFQDEYAIFYSIIADRHIGYFTLDQLEEIINNNRDLILDSPYINISKLAKVDAGFGGISTQDDEKITAVLENMKDKLIELSNMYVSEEEFNSSCLIFIDYFKNTYMLETGQNMTLIMSDHGFDEKQTSRRSQHYSGFEDAKKYYNKRMKILNELSDVNRIGSFILDKEWLANDAGLDKIRDENALMRTGIKKIDEAMGDLRRSNMLGILGPPKGGKTRFTNFLVQRALSLGLNVCVWPLEGTKEEWISNQIASYIARKHPGIEIDSKKILQRDYGDNEQIRTLVNSAKFEMVADETYGKLSFIEGAAYVEDFISILESHYDNVNPFDVIVIDSLVNILSKTGRNKVDRISSAYMELKAFISHNMKRKALAIVPAQLKQDVVDYLRKNPNETMDVTAGGESAETVRSPDEIIGLFSSKEERAANRMHIYSVASRHSASFDDFQVKASLKCCHFEDDIV